MGFDRLAISREFRQQGLQLAFAGQSESLRDDAIFRLGRRATRLGIRTGLAQKVVRRS
jgi:hypothetical protein